VEARREGSKIRLTHGGDASCGIDVQRKSVSVNKMSAPTHGSSAAFAGRWIANRPYLLLCVTALCWAGNAIVGRLAAGHIPPVTLAFLRWALAFLTILPFAWPYLVRDWKVIRERFGIMVVLSITGIGAFTGLQYWSLEHTLALNTLLLQSAGPLFVAVWSLILLGVGLTLTQLGGIALSLTGVLVILLHGDLTALASIAFNRGDIIFLAALVIFGAYSALSAKRPNIHALSFAGFTFGCGALCLVPLLVLELILRPVMRLEPLNLLALFYVAVFPSTLAYLCFNRGVQLIGANRAAPVFQLVPLFGALMAMVFLGERPQLFHLIGFALVLTGVYVASRKPAASA
jgi:drug/metabolite transporter (DMT)-like permease